VTGSHLQDKTPDWHAGYEVGYKDGESSLLADVNTLCDQLDIDIGEDEHEFAAIRSEVERLRASLRHMEEHGN
jgi:hypothetical protein